MHAQEAKALSAQRWLQPHSLLSNTLQHYFRTTADYHLGDTRASAQIKEQRLRSS